MGQLIDGKAIAAKVRGEVKEAATRLKADRGITPGLAVVRVGDDPASKVYVGGKKKAAEELGFLGRELHHPAEISQKALLELIASLNADPAIHGILVQLPLPKHLDADAAISAVAPEKDVDGFHPVNAGKVFLGRPGPRPCTPAGIMRLLQEIGFNPAGKRAVVIGRSQIVGRPMAMLLLGADATVTICHRKSDLRAELLDADLVVVAVGVPELVKGEWIKPGAVVIDVGMNRMPDGKLKGDVEFSTALERASHITPVPGGVGPMTIALLMHNTLEAARTVGR
jgi:methylenetetrahydrofolate dehydrogenase (NADP+) / methenyltetrahydrofolate cyclohydrolase